MKKIFYILFVLLFLGCGNGSEKNRHEHINRSDNAIVLKKNNKYRVKVTKIFEGDSFQALTSDNQEIECRIFGIDAPEKSQPFCDKSRKELEDLINDKEIDIIIKNTDKYNRKVVIAHLPSGENLAEIMIKSGMAWHYKRSYKSADYANWEKAARKEKLGLWQDKKPTAPWIFRENNHHNKK